MLVQLQLPMPLRLGNVNAYLWKQERNEIEEGESLPEPRFILVDTGPKSGRQALKEQLEAHGCTPKTSLLVLLTHGDFDHTGNARWLQTEYGAKIGMHIGDWPMVEAGDMFTGRKRPCAGACLLPVIRWMFGFERFTPDIDLAAEMECQSHSPCLGVAGLSIHHTPGHSSGSLSFLINKELVCGDLIENLEGEGEGERDSRDGSGDTDYDVNNVKVGSIMDNVVLARETIRGLERLGDFNMVMPGHGTPFEWHGVESIGGM